MDLEEMLQYASHELEPQVGFERRLQVALAVDLVQGSSTNWSRR